MSGMLTDLRSIAETLESLNIEYALIGALAVSIYTEPRTTRDIDIAIALSNEEEEVLIQSLMKAGYNKRSVLLHVMPTQKLGTRLQQLNGERSSTPLDLLTSSSGIEREVVESSQPIEVFPGLLIPIAIMGHLIAMKVLSENEEDRSKDRMDLKNLLKVAEPNDLEIAKEALLLIEERGFSRGKDLMQSLADIQQS